MYDTATRGRAIAALRSGSSLRAVSLQTGISRATLRDWLENPDRLTIPDCPLCVGATPEPVDLYLYLLGMYLGDGCISAAPRTTALRIACADSWPGVMAECEFAMRQVSHRSVYLVQCQGCTSVTTLWKHWPCLFPQHGPGRKHERRVHLASWQQEMVDRDPRPLIRGLIQVASAGVVCELTAA